MNNSNKAANFLLRTRILRWLVGFAVAAAVAACGGGGGGSPQETLAESANKAACSYQHLYITVQQVQVRQQAAGGEQWTEITLPAPQRIDLMNLGGGLLQALGAAPLAASHYTEVRLILASNDDGSGLANAVQPTGGSLAPLNVPSGAQSGLKLKGDFVVPAGEMGDVMLQGFDPCDAVVQTGNRNSPRYQLKPEISATVELAAVAPTETRIASGTVTPLVGGGYLASRELSTNVLALQRYGADGQPVGAETTITVGSQIGLGVAPLAGGGYGAIWLIGLEDGLYQLYGQSFTAAGAPIGSPLPIAQVNPGALSRPAAVPQVAALAGGGYVVVWGLQSATDLGVYAQRFNADGTPAGAAHLVALQGSGSLGVVGLTTGGYLVTWGTFGLAHGGVRAYSSTDVPLAPAQQAGPTWADPVSAPPSSLAALAGGGTVLVWQLPFQHLLVQQLAPNGVPLGTPRVVNDAIRVPFSSLSSVTGLPDGGYVVAWIELGGADPGVHARRFAADGTPLAPQTRINLVTTSPNFVRAITFADGSFMITWSGVGADGIHSNYARVFTASGLMGI